MKSKLKLLLIKDVDHLGRSGEVVLAKPGFARNYLMPKKLAIKADRNTLRMQEKLKEERAVKAAEDKKQALELAKEIEKISLETKVKVDPDGRMYGSVSHQDIVDLFIEKKISLSKKNIGIRKPIKQLGEVEIPIKLPEGVDSKVILTITAENPPKIKKQKKEAKENDSAADLEKNTNEDKKEDTEEN